MTSHHLINTLYTYPNKRFIYPVFSKNPFPNKERNSYERFATSVIHYRNESEISRSNYQIHTSTMNNTESSTITNKCVRRRLWDTWRRSWRRFEHSILEREEQIEVVFVVGFRHFSSADYWIHPARLCTCSDLGEKNPEPNWISFIGGSSPKFWRERRGRCLGRRRVIIGNFLGNPINLIILVEIDIGLFIAFRYYISNYIGRRSSCVRTFPKLAFQFINLILKMYVQCEMQ